jgi:hypothetical protein
MDPGTLLEHASRENMAVYQMMEPEVVEDVRKKLEPYLHYIVAIKVEKPSP